MEADSIKYYLFDSVDASTRKDSNSPPIFIPISILIAENF